MVGTQLIKEWKEYNSHQEKLEEDVKVEYSGSRKCEHCGKLGFTTKRIKGLGSKIVLQGYTLGGIKNFWYYECKNKARCKS